MAPRSGSSFHHCRCRCDLVQLQRRACARAVSGRRRSPLRLRIRRASARGHDRCQCRAASIVVYNLATTCDSACQRSRAEAAQARLLAQAPAASQPHTPCEWSIRPIKLGPEWVEWPRDRCKATLRYAKQDVELCVKVLGEDKPKGPYRWARNSRTAW